MRNIYITFLFLIFCSMAYAQEQAKYRVTYDCDAQVVTGKTNTPDFVNAPPKLDLVF